MYKFTTSSLSCSILTTPSEPEPRVSDRSICVEDNPKVGSSDSVGERQRISEVTLEFQHQRARVEDLNLQSYVRLQIAGSQTMDLHNVKSLFYMCTWSCFACGC